VKNASGGKLSLIKRASNVAVLVALISGASTAFAVTAPARVASVKTFDRVTYTYPAGFEPTPMGASDHVSFRRIDATSWILFSIYQRRVVSRDFAGEFAFDWNDINTVSGVAAPSSTARKVGLNVDAREGGVFVPSVGYIDLVDVDADGFVVPIIIECGSVDQFRSYQPVIEALLASLVVKPDPKREPGPTPATTRSVDYVDDGFVWTGADGLQHVPPLTTVASGAGFPASIPGIWQNDRDEFTLELAADGTYASAYVGGTSSGSFRIREAGRWMADGTRLILTPQSASNSSRNFSNHHGSEEEKIDAGGPRIYEVTTLVLEYSRNELSYRIDGIELNGPPAPWYDSPSGNFAIVLRRTGERRAK
jgi:hypothetical protein